MSSSELSKELIYMNWHELVVPEKTKTVSSSKNYAKFSCEPIERGFGITLGNSLRRILLSSLQGFAVVSVKFEEVLHEFSTINGIIEDVSQIIFNLKKLKVRLSDPEPQDIEIDFTATEDCVLRAEEIITKRAGIEVVNPDLKIATLLKGAQLKCTMRVETGRGYLTAAENQNEEAPIGTIFLDAIFSPIQKVKYDVDSARVGQKIDYDKLTLEIWTDGTVKPADALAYSAKILKEQLNVFINFDEEAIEPEKEEIIEEESEQKFNENIYRNVEELELSVRSANCLKNAGISKIYQLVQKTDNEMLQTKNFGRKSLNEIKDILSDMGLSLGMKLEGFVPPEEN